MSSLFEEPQKRGPGLPDVPSIQGGRKAFNSTSQLAAMASAAAVGSRRERILRLLGERGPMAMFEIAAAMGVFDHQISGRFSELIRDGLIEITGKRKTKPATGCEAEIYCLKVDDGTRGRPLDLGDALGYPLTLTIGDQGRFERAEIIERDAPGIPYARAGDGSRPRLQWRVELVECGGCGRPLKQIERGAGTNVRMSYRCGTVGCGRVWDLMIVHPPGTAPLLAMVMRHL